MTQERTNPGQVLVAKDRALEECETVLTEVLHNYVPGDSEIARRVKAARDAAVSAQLIDKEGG